MSKVPVFCSLIPSELLLAMGFEPDYLTAGLIAQPKGCSHQCVMHENICSYAKALFEYLTEHGDEYGAMIIPASCDAMKKLYSAMLERGPKERIFLLDFPRNKGPAAALFYARQLERLSDFLGERHAGSKADGRGFNYSLPQAKAHDQKIGIIGSNVCESGINDVMAEFGAMPVYLNQCFAKMEPDEAILKELSCGAGVKGAAALYVEKNACPRTNDEGFRGALIARIKRERIRGVIINGLKFCDFYPFEYVYLKESLGNDFPVLIMEHDLMSNDSGQISTRVMAFLEGIFKGDAGRKTLTKKEGAFHVGIDSGSHSTKGVLLSERLELLSFEIIPTGTSVKEAAVRCFDGLIKKAGKRKSDIRRVVATGYGRTSIDFADSNVTEITCHAIGASHLLKGSATIIDIGGQDSKAINIASDGTVKKFVMNDKCAAGTGRFLEVMADKLHMKLDEFAMLAQKGKSAVSVTSMCSVFAESEVISLLADGHGREKIAKGIHKAIAERTASLVKRIDGAPPYYMTGGVARNKALIDELSDCLGSKIEAVENPQIVGALGAAIYSTRQAAR